MPMSFSAPEPEYTLKQAFTKTATIRYRFNPPHGRIAALARFASNVKAVEAITPTIQTSWNFKIGINADL